MACQPRALERLSDIDTGLREGRAYLDLKLILQAEMSWEGCPRLAQRCGFPPGVDGGSHCEKEYFEVCH